MNSFKRTTLRLSISMFALGLAAVPGTISVANAQDEDGADDGLHIDEVIVTSRKREESLFDIPVAVTAFSAEDIVNAGIEELPDLVSHTPGFHYAENSVTRGGRFNRRLIFRGMNPRTDRQTRQAATVFIDGAPTIGSEIGTTDNYERIEIIKGPQSAHFGRQTFSGAINAITRTPGNEFAGEVSAEAGNYGRASFGLSLEGALVEDKLLFRVSGRDYSSDGEYANSADPSTQLGAESTKDAGLSLFFTPNDRFSAKLRVRRWKDEDGPSAGLSINFTDNGDLANCQPGGTGLWPSGWICGEVPFVGTSQLGMDTTLTPALQELFFNPALTSTFIFDVPVRMGLERNAEENSLVLDWELANGIVISSITAKHKNEYSSFEDFDRRETTGVGGAGGCAPVATDPTLELCFGDTYQMALTSNETFFQELRLTSSSDQSFRWAVGVSYAKVDGLTQNPGKFLTVANLRSIPVSNFDPETTAIFGSIAWDFTDRFTLSVEGRYQEDEVIEGTVGGTQFSETFTSENPRVILDFKPFEDTTIYATYAKGSQPGQFNAGVGNESEADIDILRDLFNCGSASTFDCLVIVPEEEVTNFELGIKSRFWGGRAQVSAAVYVMDWQGIVAPNIVEFTNSAGELDQIQINTLGGQADLSGLELEGTVLLSEHFTLDMTYSLVGSEIGLFESPDAATLLGFRQINGLNNQFSRYPENSGSLTLSYDGELGADRNVFVRGDLLYQGKTFMTNANVSSTAAFTTFNLRAGITSDDWRLEVYGTNIFDEKAYTAFQSFPDLSGQSDPNFAPRTLMAGFIPRASYGVRASFYF
jgi:iron complex outermembrane receptor protein